MVPSPASRLAIWIGSAEATVLALALEAVETPRPFPYKLAAGFECRREPGRGKRRAHLAQR